MRYGLLFLGYRRILWIWIKKNIQIGSFDVRRKIKGSSQEESNELIYDQIEKRSFLLFMWIRFRVLNKGFRKIRLRCLQTLSTPCNCNTLIRALEYRSNVNYWCKYCIISALPYLKPMASSVLLYLRIYANWSFNTNVFW